MLLVIVFILLIIGSALTYNVYSIFKPFIENLGNIQNYNVAYRGAISSIERAELVLRYHEAGFEGSGGWIAISSWGPDSDKKINNFGLLSRASNGMYRQIKSRISGNTIPEAGKGNVDYELQRTGTDYGGPSKNFNKLTYDEAEEFLLFYDNTTDTDYYYSGIQSIENIRPSYISGIIRLPPKIYLLSNFGNLAENVDLDGDGIGDDIIVNRSLFGIDENNENFTILPTIDVDYDNNTINETDTSIREDIINTMTQPTNPGYILYENNKNPVCKATTRSCDDPAYHNIIPTYSPFSGKNFGYIFTNGDQLHLKFSIVNLMKTNNEQIYPFLEYKIYLNTTNPISDRFFHIKGVGVANKYRVIINVTKPVVNTTAASDFTILF